MPTTWIFHSTGNTLALLMPELYTGLARVAKIKERAARGTQWAATLDAVMQDVVINNPRYAVYVAPIALGYIVSHPQFNIYAGKWAEQQILGFSYDSIPHGATAFTLTRLSFELFEALARYLPATAPLAETVRWLNAHRVLVTGAVVGTATVVYETSEFLIHRAELRAVGGDYSQINMQWGVVDTITDVASNTIGWLLAAWLPGSRPTNRAS